MNVTLVTFCRNESKIIETSGVHFLVRIVNVVKRVVDPQGFSP